MLDGAVRRTTGGDSAAPLNGRAASVQHCFKPHFCIRKNVGFENCVMCIIQF
ncbi:hypothetical protein HMPREF1325_0035 [Treponema socranskii subsp. socranskii VPI DR56BR1116 = ATCC 35536]|uniref:Uncharacterized protein n=1 Tax=Treponema socranskii subsp. socranskii VPI DR56BR1116 = ATCC 35536 TaxID=1125725 RepID=U1GQE0_TRESO|nr:hypothetical protein HMPREF1325_0035 [Treponema socranskii subsp. socranskii VPI DR56BR1116 = ATCC 35536]